MDKQSDYLIFTKKYAVKLILLKIGGWCRHFL